MRPEKDEKYIFCCRECGFLWEWTNPTRLDPTCPRCDKEWSCFVVDDPIIVESEESLPR